MFPKALQMALMPDKMERQWAFRLTSNHSTPVDLLYSVSVDCHHHTTSCRAMESTAALECSRIPALMGETVLLLPNQEQPSLPKQLKVLNHSLKPNCLFLVAVSLVFKLSVSHLCFDPLQ